MNISKALNILLSVALVLVCIKLAIVEDSIPGPNDLTRQEATTDAAAPTDTASAGQWVEVPPTEIKNAVDLFANDWMALASGREGDMNAMTIGWGGIGQLWRKPVVTVYVSSSRYTHGFMEHNPYFTVTAFPERYREALQYLGTHSGRDEADKVQNAGLTTEYTKLGNPIFREGNLAIECRTIYHAPFIRDSIDAETAKFYDNGTGMHTQYIGEIVHVWKKK